MLSVTTRKIFIEMVRKTLKTVNPSLKIYIGNGDGGYHTKQLTHFLGVPQGGYGQQLISIKKRKYICR